MNLFDNDIINISMLCSVNKGNVSDEWVKNKKTVTNFSNHAYEIVYYVSSGSSITYNNKTIKNEPGSIRYIPKGHFNNCKIFNYTPGYYIDIYFDTNEPMPDEILAYDKMEYLEEKLIKLYNVWSHKKQDYYINSIITLYNIILLIKSYQKKYFPITVTQKLDFAYKYIVENYKSVNFDYKALCETTNLSYSYFSSIFFSRYNMSPRKFVTNMKINYAKELLISNKCDSIAEVASLCGFESAFYFSKVFKKVTGVSPKNYTKLL